MWVFLCSRLSEAPIIEWYLPRLVVMNEHQKDTCMRHVWWDWSMCLKWLKIWMTIRCKICKLDLISFVNQTPIFEHFVVSMDLKWTLTKKTTLVNCFWSCAYSLLSTLHSKVNAMGGPRYSFKELLGNHHTCTKFENHNNIKEGPILNMICVEAYHRFACAIEPINASLWFVQDGEHE